ncbi:MAG: poly-gamma-glutamate system protein [bacterium]|nr:poly-gamma-glutamate system protein [bacterium]
MSWRLDRRRQLILLGLAVAALLMQVLLEYARVPVRQRDYDLKMAASQLASRAFTAVRVERGLHEGRVDLVNDPAGTGLIGPEFSLITNARGDLESKLTSVNPNFAALIVQYFRQAGLKAGDPVAVAVSGSFPALNICLYAALETMKLRPVVITSIGASMWGANDPQFTWLDMEALLAGKGIFTTRNTAATHGGGNDMGRGLSPEGRRLIEAAAARHGVPLLDATNIEEAITQRMTFWSEAQRGHAYRLSVNVGGGVASLGSSHNRLLLPSGLSYDLGDHNWARKGTLVLFAEQGVPVVHLLNVTRLAQDNGLPVAPDFLPQPGEGPLFQKDMYSFPLATVMLLIYSLGCVLILAPEVRAGLFDRLNRKPGAAAAALMVFLALAAAAPAGAAVTSWREVKPLVGGNTVCVTTDGSDVSYVALGGERGVTFEVTGPRRCKLLTRCGGALGESGGRYELTVRIDGVVTETRALAMAPDTEATACGGGAVSELRRTYFEVGPGTHRVELSGKSPAGSRVAGRLFGAVKRRGTGRAPLTPSSYGSVATLQFESGAQSTYYRFDGGRSVVLDVTGPTSLQIHTRLDFDATMSGTQNYTLELVRDGVDRKTFHLTADKLAGVVWVETPNLLPGSRHRLRVDVPPGRHRYELRCVRPEACGIAAQFQIPQADLGVPR